MEWVEVRAENIEAAEELALDQLGVAREDAEFEVVTREENRLFGLKKTEFTMKNEILYSSTRKFNLDKETFSIIFERKQS